MSAEVRPNVSVTVYLTAETTYDNPVTHPQQVYIGGHGWNNALLYSKDPAAFRQLSAALLTAANRLDERAANERATADADDYLVIVDDREGAR
jgi:hypothetical protein